MNKYVANDNEVRELPIDLVTVDVETNKEGTLISVQVAYSEVDAYFLDMRKLSKDVVAEFLKNVSPVFHYGTFDCQVLYEQLGIALYPAFDTYCAARLFFYKRHEGFGLKTLAKELLGMEMRSFADLTFEADLDKVSIENLIAYGCDDVLATFRLMNWFMDKFSGHGYEKMRKLTFMESYLGGVMAVMKSKGILFDKSASKNFQKEIQIGLEEFRLKYPEISITSNTSVSNYLFSRLKLMPDGITKLKNGNFSVKASGLESIRFQNPEVIDDILEWKKLSKLKSTYSFGYEATVRTDGAIHATFNPFGTQTGRFSSSSPNLQNVPAKGRGKELRKAFIPREGFRLVSMDYKQIELIVLAVMSNERNMLDIIDNGGDLHTLTASIIYDIPVSEVTKEQRGNAKAVNFGMIYGGGPGLFVNFVNGNWEEAENMYKAFFVGYPSLSKYLTKMGDAAFRGYTETYFGRRRQLHEYHKDMTPQMKASIFRLAKNTPIQGTAADIIKFAMVDIVKFCDPKRVQIVMQIHDELILEIHESHFEDDLNWIKGIMERQFQYMKVDIAVGDSWYDIS